MATKKRVKATVGKAQYWIHEDDMKKIREYQQDIIDRTGYAGASKGQAVAVGTSTTKKTGVFKRPSKKKP